MRAFLDVLRFELRMQCGSRLFQGVLFLFFAVHLLTLAQTGINLTDNELIHIDSPYLIFQTTRPQPLWVAAGAHLRRAVDRARL